MDLPSLVVVLRAALSHAPEERKAAEASLEQVSRPPRLAPDRAPLLPVLPLLQPRPQPLLFDLTSTGLSRSCRGVIEARIDRWIRLGV
jgi:hypothetical protein